MGLAADPATLAAAVELGDTVKSPHAAIEHDLEALKAAGQPAAHPGQRFWSSGSGALVPG